MNTPKRMLFALPIAFAVAIATPSSTVQAQGLPVIDVSNLMQQIMQYINMINQLRQLESQLRQLKDQYASITGIRHMAGIYQEDYLQKLPRNWKETLAGIEGKGKVGDLTKDIFRTASLLDSGNFEHVATDVVDQLKKNMMLEANSQALNSQAFDQSGERFARIQDLMRKIDGATDLKAISDLNGRLAGENAMLMNEMIKLQAMNAVLENQRRVQAQVQTQRRYEYKRDYLNSDK